MNIHWILNYKKICNTGKVRWFVLLPTCLLGLTIISSPAASTIENNSVSHFIHQSLKVGPYSVGYSRLSVKDYSATPQPRFDFEGHEVETIHNRTIPISFWYPANTNSGAKQLIRDYVYAYAPGIATDKITSNDKLKALSNFSQYPMQQGAKKPDLNRLLNTSMLAQTNATPKKGRFPLIVIPGGFYANFFIAPTAEYFASHGYTVAYINDSATTGISGYENQKDLLWRLSDLKQAINFLAQKSNVQWNNIGIWGYHSGGSAATLLQMQSNNVRAVVSIEGSEGWTNKATGYPALEKLPLFDPNRIKVPYMRFQSMNPAPEWYISTPDKTTWKLYDQIKYGDVYRVILNNSEHEHLSDGVRESIIPETAGRENHEQRLYLSYGLSFFNHNLKQQNDALAYLKSQPTDHGFANKFATILFKKAIPSPPQKSDLKRIYQSSGVTALETLVVKTALDQTSTIDAKLVGDLAQDYIWAEKNVKAGLEIIDVAVRVFEQDYWGPYLAGFVYGREKEHDKKVKFYQLAKKRLLADNIIDKEEKNRRLKKIESALKESD